MLDRAFCHFLFRVPCLEFWKLEFSNFNMHFLYYLCIEVFSRSSFSTSHNNVHSLESLAYCSNRVNSSQSFDPTLMPMGPEIQFFGLEAGLKRQEVFVKQTSFWDLAKSPLRLWGLPGGASMRIWNMNISIDLYPSSEVVYVYYAWLAKESYPECQCKFWSLNAESWMNSSINSYYVSKYLDKK